MHSTPPSPIFLDEVDHIHVVLPMLVVQLGGTCR
uniref:Uncharacterized protein n=1 Tax=Arundo donax TaxID=35708 RepID=A0A0A9GXZ5_ARUDO